MAENKTAVIFDLDGTLLDTIGDIARSVNTALNAFGFPGHALEKYNAFVGSGSRTLIQRALGTKLPEEQFRLLYNFYLKTYHENLCVSTKPYPGIYELLDFLTNQNIPIAVDTNKPQQHAHKLVSQFFSHYHFSAVYGQQDPLPVKPDPYLALQIANEWQIAPQNILFIGDSVQDIQTAKNSKMIPYTALWGYQTKEQLVRGGGKFFFDSPTEIKNAIMEQI